MLTEHDDMGCRWVAIDLLALALLAARMAGSVARLATPLGDAHHCTLVRHRRTLDTLTRT